MKPMDLMREDLKNIEPYIPGAGGQEIRLDANENTVGIAQEVLEELREELKTMELNRYPDSYAGELCSALAGYTGIPGERIFTGNGSDELLQWLCLVFLRPGERAVSHNPTFGMYDYFVRVAGGEMVYSETREDFSVDIDDLILKAGENQAKLVFLCNPNNPTGNRLSRQEIVRVLDNTEGIVVLDEAYGEFSGETAADLTDVYPRLIVLRTFSKFMALAGLRIGYGLCSPDMVEVLHKIKMPYNVSVFAQKAALAVLRRQDLLERYRQEFPEERARVYRELQKTEDLRVFASFTNFFLICTENALSLDGFLRENGVRIRLFDKGRLKGCLRFSLGSRKENDRMLELLQKYFGS